MNLFSLFKRELLYRFKKKKNIDHDNFSEKSLDFFFHFYGSDKSNVFKKDGDPGHGYSSFYTKHLESYKNKKINILEIGSYAGASAAALNKYLPHSKVFCFDINISNFEYSSKNIHPFGVDINDIKRVNKTLNMIFSKYKFEKFDIIIDDGSHKLSEIYLSINYFFNFLKNRGLFIIEDFKHPNYFEYNKDAEYILVDEFFENIKDKKISSNIPIIKEEQLFLINEISSINIYKGNLKESDICFLEKK